MQTKKIVSNLLSQSSILGRWWGNLQTIAQHTNIYIQFLILSFSATSAYGVLTVTLHQWGYQLPFWQFVVGVVFILILLSLFSWRFTIPSTFATWNYQWWQNANPARAKIEKMERDIEEIKELLKNKSDGK